MKGFYQEMEGYYSLLTYYYKVKDKNEWKMQEGQSSSFFYHICYCFGVNIKPHS